MTCYCNVNVFCKLISNEAAFHIERVVFWIVSESRLVS